MRAGVAPAITAPGSVRVGHATDALVTLGVRAAARWWTVGGDVGGERPLLRIARADDAVLPRAVERTRSGV